MNGKNDSKSKNNYIVMLSNRKQKNHYNFGKTITNVGEFTTDSMSVTYYNCESLQSMRESSC